MLIYISHGVQYEFVHCVIKYGGNMNEQENKENQASSQKSSLLSKFIVFLMAVVLICLLFWVVSISSKGEQISYDTYVSYVNQGKIERVELNSKQINVLTKDGKWQWFYNRDSIEKDALEVANKYNKEKVEQNTDPSLQLTKIKIVPGTTTTFNILNIIYPVLLLVVGIMMISYLVKQFKGINRNNMDFVKNRARIIPSKVKFDKVAGADEEKAQLEEIIEFLKNPDKFTRVGARIPKGVLLVGPPGTGKTLLAKAVAGEANVPFFTISGSDFMELYVGVGASRVRDLFENAKKAKPCIVFIDEIDAVGRQRGTGLGGGNDEREQTLNQLLVQMDGFEQNEGIIVMAATNRADILDPALTRPGRFDRQIYIGRPDVKGREEILRVHSENKPLASDVNLADIAKVTIGFTGADLENLMNEAALRAAKFNRTQIIMEDINKSLVKVEMGEAKHSFIISDEDKKITAYHESGHAVIGRCVKNNQPVHEVSIIQRGGAAGYTMSQPENDHAHMTRGKMLDEITMLLGGRASEKLFLDDITAGASSDIKRATDLARAMVTEYGMSDTIGTIHFGGEGSQVFIGRDYQDRVSYSEKEAGVIDGEIKKIIDKCFAEACEILEKNKDKVDTMVDVLLEKETIYKDDVELIMKGASKQEVEDAMQERAKAREEENKKRLEEEEKKKQASVPDDNYIDELLKRAEERAKQKVEESSKKEENKTEKKSEEKETKEETNKTSEKEDKKQEVENKTETVKKTRKTTSKNKNNTDEGK